MMTNTQQSLHHHTGGGASDAAAALKGANLAFSKTKPKPVPPPKPNTNIGVRGGSLAPALAANAAADRSRSTSPIQRQHTGTSVATSTTFGRDGTADMRDRLSSFLASSPAAASTASHLTPHTKLDPKSPSYIAAALAASRSASPSPQPHPSPSALTPAQVNQLHQMQSARSLRSRRDSLDEEEGMMGLPDTTSIPATGHLITMFERSEDVDPVKKSGGDSRRRPAVRTMTPEREMSPARAKAARMGIEERPVVVKAKPKVKTRPITPTPVEREVEAVTPKSQKPATKPKPRPITPTPALQRTMSDAGVKKPVAKPAKQPGSPAKRSPHRRTESEQVVQKRKPPVGLQPAAEVVEKRSMPSLEKRSMPSLAKAASVQPTRPDSKEPPVAPEPRRSRTTKAKQAAPSSPPTVSRVQTEIVSPQPKRPASKAKIRPPTPPQPRGTASKAKEPEAPPLRKPRSMASVYGHGLPLQEISRPTSATRPSTADTSSSNDTFVSASSGLTAVPDATPVRPPNLQTHSALSTPSRSSVNSSPTRATPRRTPASSTTSLPLNSLSNAIMAGSLAAARLTPSNTGNSTLSPPALPNRTKSPRLRQTLRQPPSKSDDEDEIRKKKHQKASNKHSHAEGARRRWRDEITERERRRYEAVWASNRGTLLLTPFLPQALQSDAVLPPPQDAADCVANIVAREIWRRSRLPAEELAEVWDLVDRSGRGMLSKQEFVVGMWLIDQRLRGRKIPRKVSASVWDSVQGVKVREPKGKK